MTLQLDLFAPPSIADDEPEDFSALPKIPHPRDFERLATRPVDLGRALMRASVSWVQQHAIGWPGGVDQFRARHSEPDTCEPDGDRWFCETYHHAPCPNAAAFSTWLRDDKAFRDLGTCAEYRTSFAWAVARSFEEMQAENARADAPCVYELDDTGAIIPPASFRPEDEIIATQRIDDVPVLRYEVVRGPRTYMDEPAWYAKLRDDRKNPRHLVKRDLAFGITVFAELEHTQTSIALAAVERQHRKAKSPARRE